jgi:PKD repeat protein
MDFDNEDGTLYIFLYIGSGANVYGTVDLATGAVTPLAVDDPTGEFEGATQTTAMPPVDIPWLTEVPTSGLLFPTECVTVEVIFDPMDMAAGTYTATLGLESNDPDMPFTTLPVTMTVWSPVEIMTVTYDITFLTVAFDAEVAGDELAFAWDFGDSNTSDLEDPTHTYAASGCYDVVFTATNACGLGTWSDEICVEAECIPVDGLTFTWMPTEPTVDAAVYFTATEPLTGTSPFTYTWDFGDGFGDVGQTVNHAYGAADDYEVTLMVENACGEASIVETVTVEVGMHYYYLPMLYKDG